MNAEEIIGVIDMNLMLENLGLQQWDVGNYQGDITFNLPDNVTLAEPYKMTVEVGTIDNETE